MRAPPAQSPSGRSSFQFNASLPTWAPSPGGWKRPPGPPPTSQPPNATTEPPPGTMPIAPPHQLPFSASVWAVPATDPGASRTPDREAVPAPSRGLTGRPVARSPRGTAPACPEVTQRLAPAAAVTDPTLGPFYSRDARFPWARQPRATEKGILRSAGGPRSAVAVWPGEGASPGSCLLRCGGSGVPSIPPLCATPCDSQGARHVSSPGPSRSPRPARPGAHRLAFLRLPRPLPTRGGRPGRDAVSQAVGTGPAGPAAT